MFLSAFFITNASLLFLHQLLYRAAQLVGARCGLAVAAYSLEACNHVLVFHSLNQACDALQVAVASAIEFHVCENTVLARYLNVSRTRSVCGVCYCLHGVLVGFLAKGRTACLPIVDCRIVILSVAKNLL